MANESLKAKREQAAYLTKRANHKVSRLRSARDVELAGTRYDPRKPKRNIARYTEKQLDAYNTRVSQFLDRSTQFVGDIHRRPIPSSEWKDYGTAAQAHRKFMDDRYDSIKGLRLPGAPGNPAVETIAQRRARMKSDRVMAGNPTVNDPFEPPVRVPSGITSREALKKLTRDAKKKAAKGWDDKELKRQIGEFTQMIKKIGDVELAQKVAGLTAGQFFTLWNATGFANAISQEYEQALLANQDRDQDFHQQILSNAYADAHRLVDWAQGLDLEFGRGTLRSSYFGEDKFITKQKKSALRNYMTERGIRPGDMPTT